MRFEFATANRIVFGNNVLRETIPQMLDMGRRALVVTGQDTTRAEPLLAPLRHKGILQATFSVAGEPTVELVQAGVEKARSCQADLVIGMGGGSVIDVGKVVSALLTNQGQLMDYLEVIGRSKRLSVQPVPYVAIPTTAGTGSEVTRNAVVKSSERSVKVSMRSPWMLPALAIVDPVLTYSMPPAVTAASGMDALTQLIEPFVSKKANPLVDGLCREGIQRAAQALPRAVKDGTDTAARADMSLVSLFGGLALANAKLGAVHGIAGPLGGMIPVPHGIACARLLPYVMQANVRALRERHPESPLLDRFAEVGCLLTGNPSAGATEGVQWLEKLMKALPLPPLTDYGFKRDHIPDLIHKSQRASSMQGNPISLKNEELKNILEALL